MITIKPLVRCFTTFTKLKSLNISSINLSKMHFMAIDNYIIQNSGLTKLTLMNVKMGSDELMLLSGTIRNSKKLVKLNLCSNNLRD